ncbi:hypothetical protein BD626DRAFT_615685, partial [Schizophyllum amplum]
MRKEIIFTSAALFRTENLALEMNSESSRDWIFSRGVLDLWVHNIGSTGFEPVRPSYTVIAFNVPLTHVVEDNTEIEEVNSYDTGSILRGLWAKNPAFRKPSQMTGHLLLEFANAEDANRAINEGLTICHKRVEIEKRKREPPRCRRCNTHGHYAAHAARPWTRSAAPAGTHTQLRRARPRSGSAATAGCTGMPRGRATARLSFARRRSRTSATWRTRFRTTSRMSSGRMPQPRRR